MQDAQVTKSLPFSLIGDKTCKMLDDKLAQHVATYGTTAPVNTTNTVSDTSPRNTGKMAASSHTAVGVHKRQNSQDHRAVGGKQVGQVDAGGPKVQRAHEMSDSSDEEMEQPARVRKQY